MSQRFYEKFVSKLSEEDRLVYEQEMASLQATELILRLMDEQDIKHNGLAKKLKKSKSNISQILNGTRNMTFHTFSSILYHLGQRFLPKSEPLHQPVNKPQPVPCEGPGEIASWNANPWVLQNRTGFSFAGCSDKLEPSMETIPA